MPVKQQRAATLDEDLDMFLDELCAKWNYRNELTGAELIARKSPVTALDFTRAVLEAEGLKPDSEHNLVRQIKRKFIQRYGLEVSPETFQGIGSAFAQPAAPDLMVGQQPPVTLKPVVDAGQAQRVPDHRLVGTDGGLADGRFNVADHVQRPERAA